jgi:hypothetical protein
MLTAVKVVMLWRLPSSKTSKSSAVRPVTGFAVFVGDVDVDLHQFDAAAERRCRRALREGVWQLRQLTDPARRVPRPSWRRARR